LKFGLFFEWPNPELREYRDIFSEGLEQIKLSESLGFDYVLIAEHHFSNYGFSPAPLLQALKIAENTETIKIGTAAIIVPEWQPVRAAEEIAVLDQLTEGRIFCGVGRGYQPYEMGGFGIDLEESRPRFQEGLEVMMKAWREHKDWTYDGEYIKIKEPITVFPKPFQKPNPPLWLAGSSEGSLKLAADEDILPLTSSMMGMEAVSQQFASYVRYRRAAGKSLDDLSMALQCMTHCAPTMKEALDQIPYIRWQIRAQKALTAKKVIDGKTQGVPYEGEMPEELFLDRTYLGDPDYLIEKFKKANDAGITNISLWMMWGGIEHEKLMRSIKLMGEKVIPELRDLAPPKSVIVNALRSEAMEPKGGSFTVTGEKLENS